VKDWLGKRLEAWADRHERRDEEVAALVSRNIDAMSNRRTLRLYVAALAAANALVWLSVIVFPKDVGRAWESVNDLNEKIGLAVLAIVFGLGLWLTYSLFRLKFPDLEDPAFEEDVLASFNYSLHSTKRWRVWLVSVIGGVLNVLMLIFLDVFLSFGL
jgi:hypothetical protein